jgi:hypothetical protein
MSSIIIKRNANILFYCFFGILFLANTVNSQLMNPRYYDVGNPVLKDIWVDPINGNDNNSGETRSLAVKTIQAAWNLLPSINTSTGYKIKLVQGEYAYRDQSTGNIIGLYLDEKHGTFSFPIVFESADGTGKSKILSPFDFRDISYIYLQGLDFETDRNSDGGGNTIHFADGDHILIKNCTLNGFDGIERKPQETLKVNQVSNIFVEDSDISGAFWFSLDYMAVRYGHIQGCKIHDASMDCLLLKGGTTQIRVESNIVYNAERFGLSAGQGSGFDFLVPPWIHYDAYDLKFINNIIHNTNYAGIAVLGAYNILAAYNTFYKIGIDKNIDASLISCGLAQRGCNDPEMSDSCNAHHALGGWSPGLWSAPSLPYGEEADCIPNKNIYIYNNIFYNPFPDSTLGGHLEIRAPYDASERSSSFLVSSNISAPALSDNNLQIKGNIIWNGFKDKYLGIGDETGCRDTNKTCNTTLILANNTINKIEPGFRNPSILDFRILSGSNLINSQTYSAPPFPGNDTPIQMVIPIGNLNNTVTRDFNGNARTGISPPGAFFTESGNSIKLKSDSPGKFFLHRNFPNPFNGSSAIDYQLFVPGKVSLKIFDILGREVSDLVREYKQPGLYRAIFDGKGLPSGVYFMRFAFENLSEIRQMILMK